MRKVMAETRKSPGLRLQRLVCDVGARFATWRTVLRPRAMIGRIEMTPKAGTWVIASAGKAHSSLDDDDDDDDDGDEHRI